MPTSARSHTPLSMCLPNPLPRLQVLEGINGAIFAYGQTGSGKTFSMEGGADDE